MNRIPSIRERLFALQDTGYADFHHRLVPGVERERIIGVRMPQLRLLAKTLSREEDYSSFLAELPHLYYDEYHLHGLLISAIRDYDVCVSELDRFLPYVDNWATCDLLSPRIFQQSVFADRLLADIQRWMSSSYPFIVRFGIGMLMSHFLDAHFLPEYLQWVAKCTDEHYYIRMMVAWYFATALAKQWDATLPVLESRCLPRWTHTMTIRKATESLRISPERKTYLRTLRQ